MEILVTGADGFVGSALCKYLLKQGEIVKGTVRYQDQKAPGGVMRIVSGEINADTCWQKALGSVDVIIHTAARVHVMDDSSADPLASYREVNVEGTLNLARQAASAGVKRMVFISSIKVNGEETALGTPFTERDPPAPVDPYGISKFEAEIGLREIAIQSGMDVVIVRPPLVYGPGVKANFINMVRWVSKGVPLPLGSINNKRSFIALDNLVDFLYCCAQHPRAANQVFLISDGEDLSTSDLLRRMAVALDKPKRLVPIPQVILVFLGWLVRKRAMISRLVGSLQVDSSSARELLKWKPKLSVDQALKKVAKAYANEKNL